MENDKYLILFNAIIKDCKKIMESYNEYQEGAHYQNAKYVMEQIIEDTADDEDGFYAKKGEIVKWYKLFLSKNFYLDSKDSIEFSKLHGPDKFFCFPESSLVKHHLKDAFPYVKDFKNVSPSEEV
jgi:hypothetical protein